MLWHLLWLPTAISFVGVAASLVLAQAADPTISAPWVSGIIQLVTTGGFGGLLWYLVVKQLPAIEDRHRVDHKEWLAAIEKQDAEWRAYAEKRDDEWLAYVAKQHNEYQTVLWDLDEYLREVREKRGRKAQP